MIHMARMSALLILLLLCLLLPYLPGRYDPLAVTLSFMAQVFALTGLLLVPIGAMWLAYELRRKPGGSTEPKAIDRGPLFAWASVALGTVVALAVALAAAVSAGVSLGIGLVTLWVFCVSRMVAAAKGMTGRTNRAFCATPVYLMVLPLTAAVAKFTLVAPAAEFSRNRAIANSAPLIADIERFRAERGHYPPSLLSLWTDYPPGVLGISRYYYEPSGLAYNLFFEQLAMDLDAKEIVMFNPLDEHQMTSHDMDLLQFSGEQLDRRRGYVALRNASAPNWKYFLFD